jgi:iron complex outermembrane recepter protein
MYKVFCAAVFFALFSLQTAFAQGLTIAVADEKKDPLIGATIELISLADSASRFDITGDGGRAAFEGVSNGLYIVNIRYVGFETFEKTIKVGPGQRNYTFQMQEESVALGAVTVTARRPLIRQDGDKMIIDPEPLASISTNALEILETTPGLFVDPDGGVFLSSATPAQILINGREQRMSTQDMMNILRSLPPGSIQRIEVLRTPSTRYDAASSGGIVDIILKKGVSLGRFGSVNIGMNQGVYGNQFAGFSLNNSVGNSGWYLNANYNRSESEQRSNLFRFLTDEYNLTQTARNRNRGDQGFIGYGLNYNPNDNLDLNYDGRLNAGLNYSNGLNANLIGAPGEEPLSAVENRIENRSPSISLQQDLGAIWKLDTIGSMWETKFGYNIRQGVNDQDYRVDVLFPLLSPVQGEGNNLQTRHFFLFQSDLTYIFAGATKLETGIKNASQDFKSRANYFFRENGSLSPDDRRTNAFNYRESISAAYLQASRPLGAQITLKAGLRVEHTWMEGNQTVPADTSFLVNRFDWFPYLFLSRPIVKMAGFDLSGYLIYRRTINRPGYQNLNPYISYIDEFQYETGNPALLPQFTHNVEANISLDNMPIFAVGQNRTDGLFTNVLYQDAERPELAVRTFDNIGESRETYFRAVAGIPPSGKYFFVAGAQYNLNEYDGVYFNEPLSFRRGSWRFFTFHSLTISKNTRLTMSGFMSIKGQQNLFELGDFGQLNFGLTQYFLDKKLQLSLSARDVLRTMVVPYQLEQGDIFFSGDRYNDNRRFGVSARYNIGLKKREDRQNMMRFDMGE